MCAKAFSTAACVILLCSGVAHASLTFAIKDTIPLNGNPLFIEGSIRWIARHVVPREDQCFPNPLLHLYGSFDGDYSVRNDSDVVVGVYERVTAGHRYKECTLEFHTREAKYGSYLLLVVPAVLITARSSEQQVIYSPAHYSSSEIVCTTLTGLLINVTARIQNNILIIDDQGVGNVTADGFCKVVASSGSALNLTFYLRVTTDETLMGIIGAVRIQSAVPSYEGNRWSIVDADPTSVAWSLLVGAADVTNIYSQEILMRLTTSERILGSFTCMFFQLVDSNSVGVDCLSLEANPSIARLEVGVQGRDSHNITEYIHHSVDVVPHLYQCDVPMTVENGGMAWWEISQASLQELVQDRRARLLFLVGNQQHVASTSQQLLQTSSILLEIIGGSTNESLRIRTLRCSGAVRSSFPPCEVSYTHYEAIQRDPWTVNITGGLITLDTADRRQLAVEKFDAPSSIQLSSCARAEHKPRLHSPPPARFTWKLNFLSIAERVAYWELTMFTSSLARSTMLSSLRFYGCSSAGSEHDGVRWIDVAKVIILQKMGEPCVMMHASSVIYIIPATPRDDRHMWSNATDAPWKEADKIPAIIAQPEGEIGYRICIQLHQAISLSHWQMRLLSSDGSTGHWSTRVEHVTCDIPSHNFGMVLYGSPIPRSQPSGVHILLAGIHISSAEIYLGEGLPSAIYSTILVHELAAPDLFDAIPEPAVARLSPKSVVSTNYAAIYGILRDGRNKCLYRLDAAVTLVVRTLAGDANTSWLLYNETVWTDDRNCSGVSLIAAVVPGSYVVSIETLGGSVAQLHISVPSKAIDWTKVRLDTNLIDRIHPRACQPWLARIFVFDAAGNSTVITTMDAIVFLAQNTTSVIGRPLLEPYSSFIDVEFDLRASGTFEVCISYLAAGALSTHCLDTLLQISPGSWRGDVSLRSTQSIAAGSWIPLSVAFWDACQNNIPTPIFDLNISVTINGSASEVRSLTNRFELSSFPFSETLTCIGEELQLLNTGYTVEAWYCNPNQGTQTLSIAFNSSVAATVAKFIVEVAATWDVTKASRVFITPLDGGSIIQLVATHVAVVALHFVNNSTQSTHSLDCTMHAAEWRCYTSLHISQLCGYDLVSATGHAWTLALPEWSCASDWNALPVGQALRDISGVYSHTQCNDSAKSSVCIAAGVGTSLLINLVPAEQLHDDNAECLNNTWKLSSATTFFDEFSNAVNTSVPTVFEQDCLLLSALLLCNSSCSLQVAACCRQSVGRSSVVLQNLSGITPLGPEESFQVLRSAMPLNGSENLVDIQPENGLVFVDGRGCFNAVFTVNAPCQLELVGEITIAIGVGDVVSPASELAAWTMSMNSTYRCNQPGRQLIVNACSARLLDPLGLAIWWTATGFNAYKTSRFVVVQATTGYPEAVSDLLLQQLSVSVPNATVGSLQNIRSWWLPFQPCSHLYSGRTTVEAVNSTKLVCSFHLGFENIESGCTLSLACIASTAGLLTIDARLLSPHAPTNTTFAFTHRFINATSIAVSAKATQLLTSLAGADAGSTTLSLTLQGVDSVSDHEFVMLLRPLNTDYVAYETKLASVYTAALPLDVLRTCANCTLFVRRRARNSADGELTQVMDDATQQPLVVDASNASRPTRVLATPMAWYLPSAGPLVDGSAILAWSLGSEGTRIQHCIVASTAAGTSIGPCYSTGTFASFTERVHPAMSAYVQHAFPPQNARCKETINPADPTIDCTFTATTTKSLTTQLLLNLSSNAVFAQSLSLPNAVSCDELSTFSMYAPNNPFLARWVGAVGLTLPALSSLMHANMSQSSHVACVFSSVDDWRSVSKPALVAQARGSYNVTYLSVSIATTEVFPKVCGIREGTFSITPTSASFLSQVDAIIIHTGDVPYRSSAQVSSLDSVTYLVSQLPFTLYIRNSKSGILTYNTLTTLPPRVVTMPLTLGNLLSGFDRALVGVDAFCVQVWYEDCLGLTGFPRSALTYAWTAEFDGTKLRSNLNSQQGRAFFQEFCLPDDFQSVNSNHQLIIKQQDDSETAPTVRSVFTLASTNSAPTITAVLYGCESVLAVGQTNTLYLTISTLDGNLEKALPQSAVLLQTDQLLCESTDLYFATRLRSLNATVVSEGNVSLSFSIASASCGPKTVAAYVYGQRVASCTLPDLTVAYDPVATTLRSVLKVQDNYGQDVTEESSIVTRAGIAQQLTVELRNSIYELVNASAFVSASLDFVKHLNGSVSNASPCQVSVSGLQIEYVCNQSGWYNLSLLVDGTAFSIPNSLIQVLPAGVEASSSVVTGPTSIVTGTCGRYFIQPIDGFGNKHAAPLSTAYVARMGLSVRLDWVDLDSELGASMIWDEPDFDHENASIVFPAMRQPSYGLPWQKFASGGNGMISVLACAIPPAEVTKPLGTRWLRVSLFSNQTFFGVIGTQPQTSVQWLPGPPAEMHSRLETKSPISVKQTIDILLFDQFANNYTDYATAIQSAWPITHLAAVHQATRKAYLIQMTGIIAGLVSYSAQNLSLPGSYSLIFPLGTSWLRGTTELLPMIEIDREPDYSNQVIMQAFSLICSCNAASRNSTLRLLLVRTGTDVPLNITLLLQNSAGMISVLQADTMRMIGNEGMEVAFILPQVQRGEVLNFTLLANNFEVAQVAPSETALDPTLECILSGCEASSSIQTLPYDAIALGNYIRANHTIAVMPVHWQSPDPLFATADRPITLIYRRDYSKLGAAKTDFQLIWSLVNSSLPSVMTTCEYVSWVTPFDVQVTCGTVGPGKYVVNITTLPYDLSATISVDITLTPPNTLARLFQATYDIPRCDGVACYHQVNIESSYAHPPTWSLGTVDRYFCGNTLASSIRQGNTEILTFTCAGDLSLGSHGVRQLVSSPFCDCSKQAAQLIVEGLRALVVRPGSLVSINISSTPNLFSTCNCDIRILAAVEGNSAEFGCTHNLCWNGTVLEAGTGWLNLTSSVTAPDVIAPLVLHVYSAIGNMQTEVANSPLQVWVVEPDVPLVDVRPMCAGCVLISKSDTSATIAVFDPSKVVISFVAYGLSDLLFGQLWRLSHVSENCSVDVIRENLVSHILAISSTQLHCSFLLSWPGHQGFDMNIEFASNNSYAFLTTTEASANSVVYDIPNACGIANDLESLSFSLLPHYGLPQAVQARRTCVRQNTLRLELNHPVPVQGATLAAAIGSFAMLNMQTAGNISRSMENFAFIVDDKEGTLNISVAPAEVGQLDVLLVALPLGQESYDSLVFRLEQSLAFSVKLSTGGDYWIFIYQDGLLLPSLPGCIKYRCFALGEQPATLSHFVGRVPSMIVLSQNPTTSVSLCGAVIPPQRIRNGVLRYNLSTVLDPVTLEPAAHYSLRVGDHIVDIQLNLRCAGLLAVSLESSELISGVPIVGSASSMVTEFLRYRRAAHAPFVTVPNGAALTPSYPLITTNAIGAHTVLESPPLSYSLCWKTVQMSSSSSSHEISDCLVDGKNAFCYGNYSMLIYVTVVLCTPTAPLLYLDSEIDAQVASKWFPSLFPDDVTFLGTSVDKADIRDSWIISGLYIIDSLLHESSRNYSLTDLSIVVDHSRRSLVYGQFNISSAFRRWVPSFSTDSRHPRCPFWSPIPCGATTCTDDRSACNAATTITVGTTERCRPIAFTSMTTGNEMIGIWVMHEDANKISCGREVLTGQYGQNELNSSATVCPARWLQCPSSPACAHPAIWPHGCGESTSISSLYHTTQLPISCPSTAPFLCPDNICVAHRANCATSDFGDMVSREIAYQLDQTKSQSLSVLCPGGMELVMGMCAPSAQLDRHSWIAHRCQRLGMVLCSGGTACAISITTCPIITPCSFPTLIWCASKRQCVASVDRCLWVGDDFITPVLDNSASSQSLTAGSVSVSGNQLIITPAATFSAFIDASRPAACPASTPYLCANGHCVGSAFLAEQNCQAILATLCRGKLASSAAEPTLSINSCFQARPVMCQVDGVMACVEAQYHASPQTGLELCSKVSMPGETRPVVQSMNVTHSRCTDTAFNGALWPLSRGIHVERLQAVASCSRVILDGKQAFPRQDFIIPFETPVSIPVPWLASGFVLLSFSGPSHHSCSVALAAAEDSILPAISLRMCSAPAILNVTFSWSIVYFSADTQLQSSYSGDHGIFQFRLRSSMTAAGRLLQPEPPTKGSSTSPLRRLQAETASTTNGSVLFVYHTVPVTVSTDTIIEIVRSRDALGGVPSRLTDSDDLALIASVTVTVVTVFVFLFVYVYRRKLLRSKPASTGKPTVNVDTEPARQAGHALESVKIGVHSPGQSWLLNPMQMQDNPNRNMSYQARRNPAQAGDGDTVIRMEGKHGPSRGVREIRSPPRPAKAANVSPKNSGEARQLGMHNFAVGGLMKFRPQRVRGNNVVPTAKQLQAFVPSPLSPRSRAPVIPQGRNSAAEAKRLSIFFSGVVHKRPSTVPTGPATRSRPSRLGAPLSPSSPTSSSPVSKVNPVQYARRVLLSPGQFRSPLSTPASPVAFRATPASTPSRNTPSPRPLTSRGSFFAQPSPKGDTHATRW